MKRLFLLDAYAMIYRAYYAFMRMPRINSKGMNTSAIFGFVNTLQELLKKENPTHIAVAFDPAGPTFRHEAYEEYKANREATPEDIRAAVPVIKEIVRAYCIPAIEVPGYEADDVIGTLARQAEAKGFDTYMMTPDKDYGQLVSEHTFIYRPRFGESGFEVMGVREVLEKWGIERVPQVIDLLGLMGDASDNIPGCPGVGEKTAVKLLREFGSIDGLLANTDKLKGALKAKVEANRRQIEFSRFLATIKTDVPIEMDEAALVREEPDKDELIRLFRELEFYSHLKRLTGDAPERRNAVATEQNLFGDETPEAVAATAAGETGGRDSSLATVENTPHTYHCVTDGADVDALAARLSAAAHFCFDTETTDLHVLHAELVGMSFAFEPHEAYYVPFPAEREGASALLEKFRPALENEKIEKTGHNIKYDLMVLGNYGVTLRGRLFDTMIAHYLLQPEMRHGMDYLSETLLSYEPIHIEELIGAKGKGQKSMRQVDVAAVADYAAEDADVTLQLRRVLEPQLEEQGLMPLFHDIEMPLMRVLAKMERTGMIIDDFALAQTSQTMTADMLRIEREIQEVAGDTSFNVSSPKQIGELLFDRLHIADRARKTKKGQYVTDEETLEALRDRHPVVGKILEYRGLKKLISTYIDALPKLIDPQTGRIHTSFNQTVTATGRLSSSNPNLQNIPVRDEQGKEIRRSFIASPGYRFLSADYSQVELRIMAHLSGDTHMVEAFRADQDIHAATAAKIYHLPIEEVTRDMRRKAKTANFGIIYGISAFGLAERLSISRAEAKELIDGYFASFPQVKEYMDGCIARARETGYVETLLGRRRYLPDINSRNANVRGFAERNAINAPIQGTAADIIKIAMVRIDRRMEREGVRSEMILQVHDELNFNVPEDEVELMTRIVREEMEGAFALKVPLRVDVGVGGNWLEAH